jgi:two-component system, LytTR family, response regulator
MIRTLIVDDMLLGRKRLRRHLEEFRDIEIVGEASDGREAIDAIGRLNPQLVFLDVQMPEVDGFDVLSAVGADAIPAVVFVTAHEEFALKAFEMHAIDYLLKPFDTARLHKAVERARRQIVSATDDSAVRLDALLRRIATGARQARRIAIKADGRTVFLPTDDIDYIEAAGNYLRIVTSGAGGTAYMVRDRISEMERRLDPAIFARVHRSTIVNLSRIKEMHPLFNGDQTLILTNGTRVTLSRTYREQVLKLLEQQ